MSRADIFLYGGGAFLAGTFLAGFYFNIYLILSILILLILFFRFPTMLLIPFFAGYFYFFLYHEAKTSFEIIPFEESVVTQGIISNEPKIFEKAQVFDIRLKHPHRGRVRIITNPREPYSYGDVIEIAGVIEEAPQRTNEAHSVFFPEIRRLDSEQGNFLKHSLFSIKRAVVEKMRAILPWKEAALLSGILLGTQSGFSEEVRSAMAKSGTTHLVALSGYNITILVFAISYILKRFLSRRITFYLTILSIACFVVMVGGEPSIVRAAIMGFLILIATQSGRVYSVMHAIIFAGLIMIFHNPYILHFDLGFQLSFLSLIGIVYLSPLLGRFIFQHKKYDDSALLDWKNQLVMTTSAQMMVMPILMSSFGNFSLIALIANVLILGLIPITMGLGAVTIFLAFIFYPIGLFFSYLLSPLLSYEIWVIEFFGSVAAPLPNFFGNSIFTLSYYALLFSLMYYFQAYRLSGQKINQ